MKKVLLAAILGIGLVSQIHAATSWSNYREIKDLYPQVYGYYFELEGMATLDSTSTCPGRFSIVKSHVNYDDLVKTLMLAFALNKTITVVYETGFTGCGTPVDRFILK